MKIFTISLGCDKNLVDTEKMLGFFQEKQYELVDQELDADIILVNTCAFINDAKEESIQTILEMAHYKEIGKCKALLVTGCLGQRFAQDIIEQLPEVDGILGTNDYSHLEEVIQKALNGERPVFTDGIATGQFFQAKRVVSSPGHCAYLKIAEGCDKHCTYCIIPSMRGSYRSVLMETLVEEARTLALAGVKELILVAQETTLYGIDIYGKKMIGQLLDHLNEIPGLEWIRILYCYPEEIDDEFIQAILRNSKVCHYLDIPIQHASDSLLKKMGRRTTRLELEAIIENLRLKIPDIALRTTIICGFPGETDADHQELLTFLNKIEFDRLGVFTYSPEEGTPAATYEDQVPAQLALSRKEEVMELSEAIVFDKNEAFTGCDLKIMVEGKVTDEHTYVGRTYRDAPEVDGLVFFSSEEEFLTGEFVTVKITAGYDYDMIGELK